MLYELRDKKENKFNIAGSLKNILAFLDYPLDLDESEVHYKLSKDNQYQNKYVSYYIKKTAVHVTDKAGNYLADVRDVLEGLNVIDWFEWQDGEEYEPNYYDVVDDDSFSLL